MAKDSAAGKAEEKKKPASAAAAKKKAAVNNKDKAAIAKSGAPAANDAAPAAQPLPAPAAKKAAPLTAAPEPKPKKKPAKLVRDSFTMPENEYQVLADIKRKCLKAGIEMKKSQLLRIGVALIRDMRVEQLQEVLATLPPLKTGRPRKEKSKPA